MARLRVLVAEDEKLAREALVRYLSRTYEVSAAADGEEAIRMLGESKYDVVLTDIKMPKANGDAVVRAAGGIPVIVTTAYSDSETVQTMLREGAIDYIVKPFKFEKLDAVIPNAMSRWSKARGVAVDKGGGDAPKPASVKHRHNANMPTRELSDGTLIYMSEPMEKVYDLLDRYAKRSDMTIVLTGETGVGKELAAKYIHEQSGRSGRYEAVNCAAIHENLAESELFGHAEGAFTDAKESKTGAIERANNGTLFLDEIEALSLDIQTKLRRVLQDHKIDPVGGGGKTIISNFRLVCATNVDPDELGKTGKLREDFRYRIGRKIEIPPLRKRKSEILPLLYGFIAKYSQQQGKSEQVKLSPEAESLLVDFCWRGNIRQLNSIANSIVVECDGTVTPNEIRELLETLPDLYSDAQEEAGNLAQTEKAKILQVLKECDGNRTNAAEKLGISRKTIQRKLKEWGIEA
ncbi:MAG: sigma-54 dependent transcriptional regulator [Victivallaceae bacterium]|nr:sigma-54 dependent transcriptional regulator [Victivallaceae bacterium]